MSRIKETFDALKKEGRAAFITYTMAFDPDREASLSILESLAESGADILELGIPFSDPMAEGPTIQAAAERALKNGATVRGVLDIVADFRKNNNDTPIVLMGYYNPIHHYGAEKFVKHATDAGVDGFIIVDLPPEEEEEFTNFAYPAGLDLIKLSAPTTDEARAKIVYEDARGFAYYVSITGVTGTKTADFTAVKKQLELIRNHTDLPIAVGFGIKTTEHVAEVSKFADAVVVGSAIVKIIEENKENSVNKVKDFCLTLSQALK